MNEHQQIQELLAVYNDLNPDERRQVDQHTQDCESCAARLADYQAQDRDLAALPSPQPDARLRENFAALEQHSRQRQRPTGRQILQYAFVASLCALALMVVLEAIHIFQSYRAVQRAAREAARWAVTYQPERGMKEDGTPLYENESEADYMARRTRLIKQVATEQLEGLDIDEVEVWGFPGFYAAAQADHPSLPGMPVLVSVTHDTELNNPIFRALVPQVRFTAQAEMINEGTQAGRGNIAPPSIGVLPPVPTTSASSMLTDERSYLGSSESYNQRIDDTLAAPGNSASSSLSSSWPAPGQNAASANSQRRILKNARLDLQVDDVDQALDEISQLVNFEQGYIINQRVWYDGATKFAAITLAVPEQEFENTLRSLRKLAARVSSEEASGADVSEQYVDLEARLQNLQATRERVRGFLDQAQSVEEALQVNRELSAIEEQVEQIQGQLNSLRQRVAFSSITVNLAPVTPPPPSEHWRPGDMVQKAVDVLVGIGQTVMDALLWAVIVLGPLFAVVYVLVWGVIKLVRR